jgi:hypothetical protein
VMQTAAFPRGQDRSLNLRAGAGTKLGHIAEAPAAGLSATQAAGRAACVLALLRAIETVRREEREVASRNRDAGHGASNGLGGYLTQELLAPV